MFRGLAPETLVSSDCFTKLNEASKGDLKTLGFQDNGQTFLEGILNALTHKNETYETIFTL